MVLHRILWNDILRLLCYFFCGQWRLRCVFLRFGGLSAKSFSESCQSTGTHCSDGMVVPEHLSLLAEGGNKLDDFHSFENDYWWSWVVDARNNTKQIPIVNRLPVFGGEAVEGPGVLEITETWGVLCHSMSL